MMILAFVLAALVISGLVQVWMIVLLAFLLGIANAVDMPVRQAFAVELVGREDVGNAVALNSAMFNGARIVGPAAAGLAIGAFGVAAAFLINGLSFLAVIIGLRLIDERELELPPRIARPTSARAVVQNLAEGLAYVRQTPVVLLAVVVVGSVATVGMNWGVLIPPFAQGELHSDASGYGFLMAASGVGSLLAALRLVFGGRPRPTRLAVGALILGVASVALAASRVFPISLGLMVVIGFGSILMAATGNTTIQLAVPESPPRPGHERLHDGVQRIGADRRSRVRRRGVGLRDIRLDRAWRDPDAGSRHRRAGLGTTRRVCASECFASLTTRHRWFRVRGGSPASSLTTELSLERHRTRAPR